MIPKAMVLALAKEESVLITTVEKDYALGWLLFGVARHPVLSQWVFKGGTCLKKCFFETYRFSEDLDFTVPEEQPLNEALNADSLQEICDWVSEESGIEFARQDLKTEEYTNKQGSSSFIAKVAYSGPLRMARRSLQRVKFDITQNERIVDPAVLREVAHRYGDAPTPVPQVGCYSVDEILAEKTRALYERQGRARDVYDIVHINRVIRSEIDPNRALEIVKEKFAFKRLPSPSVKGILQRIDWDVFRANWKEQLSHQLPVLPDADGFREELEEALTWWMNPVDAVVPPASLVTKFGGALLLPRRFPEPRPLGGSGRSWAEPTGVALERLRIGARNRLCVEFEYSGIVRRVEPYSLRHSTRGNLLFFGHELNRGARATDQIKGYNVEKIGVVRVTDATYRARWAVEL